MKNYLKPLLGLLSVAIITLSVSCSKSDDPAKGKLLVVHASPDAPGVDLLIDNVKKNSAALTFPNNTGYLDVNAGTRNIKVNASGTSTTVINADLSVVSNKNYSVFAYKALSSIAAIAVEDNLTAPASGNAHVRFFHLSPDAPAVTIGTVSGGTFTAIPAFTNRSFETQTSATANAAFTPLPAGTYNLQVRVAGTTTVALDLPGITLTAGKIYTVFARGFLAGTGAQALNAQIIQNN